MARPQVVEISHDRESLDLDIHNDEAATDVLEMVVANEGEEEFHTSESDNSDEEDYHNGSLPPTAPLLPAEILKPLPSPVQSLEEVPWDRLTRKQKVSRRNQSRQAKKRAWDQLKKSTNGTGVLEAGRVAQLKRGVVASREKVKSGRVGKKTQVKMSGRQQLLEQRKRLAGEKNGVVIAPKKRKTRTVKDKR